MHDRYAGHRYRADQERATPPRTHALELTDRLVYVTEVDARDRQQPLREPVNRVREPRVACVNDFAGEVAIIEEPCVDHALEADHRLEINRVLIEPRHTRARRRGVVHGRALIPIIIGLLAGPGDGCDARWQELLPRRPVLTGHPREDVARDDLGRDLRSIELRQSTSKLRVRVEPSRTWLEV